MKETLEATKNLVLSGEDSNRVLVDLATFDLPWIKKRLRH
jgi:hypothetical protein